MHRIPRTLKLGLALMSILSFVALSAFGQVTINRSYLQDPAPMKAPQTVTINGKVAAVTENSLTVVDDQKASQTVSIDAKTKVMKAGKAVSTAEIKPDDAVVVVARKGDGDALTAISIKVS